MQRTASVGYLARNASQFPTSTTAQASTQLDKDIRRGPFVCEFLGTAMFAFAVTCCKFCGNPAWNATTIGFTYMVLTYAVGPASGGNLNPAISLALAFLGKLRYPVAAGYMLVQIMGGIIGTFVAKFVLFPGFPPRFLAAPIAPFGWREVASVEVLFTAMVVFVAANCTVSAKNNPSNDRNQFYGLAIGCSIIAGGYAACDISGGVLNPAVAASLINPTKADGFSYGMCYAGLEIIGGCFGAVLYCLCRPSSEDAEESGPVARSPVQERSLGTRLSSEFLGTFFLALTIGLCLVTKPAAVPMAAAAALISMVYSVGTVSGGHFNPAVTLAVVLGGRDKCGAAEGSVYGIMQFAAGLVAGFLVAAVSGFRKLGMPLDSVLAPKQHYSWTEMFAAELVFTMLLAYVVLSVTTGPLLPSLTRQTFYFGLAVGACYLVAGSAVGAISGGILNPAVATGVALESCIMVSWQALWKPSTVLVHGAGPLLKSHELLLGGFSQVSNLFQFTVAELMGGAFAAAAFALTHPQEFADKERRYFRDDDPTLSLL